MSSAFTINNLSIEYPSGSIMSYLGTTDPEGWLICNGRTVTSTDGRYVNLAPILNSINNNPLNDSNNIKLPDLREKFLYGNTSVGTSYGSNTVTLTSSNMPTHTHNVVLNSTHNHSLTIGEHSHSIYASSGNTTGMNQDTNNTTGDLFGDWYQTSNTTVNYLTTSNSKTNVTFGNSYAFSNDSVGNGITVTLANTGIADPIDITPPYSAFNFIIKI